MDGPWPKIGPCAMTEWGNRGLSLFQSGLRASFWNGLLVTVEKAELESAGEGEQNEDDQRGCGWNGHAHAGSVLPISP
jgi:hypothetical protein